MHKAEPIDAPLYRYEIELAIQGGSVAELGWYIIWYCDFTGYRLPMTGETIRIDLDSGMNFTFTVTQISHLEQPVVEIKVYCPEIHEMGLEAFDKYLWMSLRQGELGGPLSKFELRPS